MIERDLRVVALHEAPFELSEQSKMQSHKPKTSKKSKVAGAAKISLYKGVIYACKIILEELFLRTND
jgi:hypothetical protein